MVGTMSAQYKNVLDEFDPDYFLSGPLEQSDAYLLREKQRAKNKRSTGARGDHNRRIIFSRTEGDRELSFHATKGWRNNRKA